MNIINFWLIDFLVVYLFNICFPDFIASTQGPSTLSKISEILIRPDPLRYCVHVCSGVRSMLLALCTAYIWVPSQWHTTKCCIAGFYCESFNFTNFAISNALARITHFWICISSICFLLDIIFKNYLFYCYAGQEFSSNRFFSILTL